MDWRAVRAERRAAREVMRAERRRWYQAMNAPKAVAPTDPAMPPLMAAASLLLPSQPSSEGSSLQLDSLAAALLSTELESAQPAWEGSSQPLPLSEPPIPRHTVVSVRSIFYTTSLPALLLSHPALGCEDLCALLDGMWQEVHPGEALYLPTHADLLHGALCSISTGRTWGHVGPGAAAQWALLSREEQMGRLIERRG